MGLRFLTASTIDDHRVRRRVLIAMRLAAIYPRSFAVRGRRAGECAVSASKQRAEFILNAHLTTAIDRCASC